MSAETVHSQTSSGRVVRTLVALGDSTTVGIGDPLPRRRWRGFGPLLAAALGEPGQVRFLNDVVVARHNALCLDLHRMPGAYDVAAWSVDRLHPSELGHRMLARGFAGLLADAGCLVPNQISLACSGGVQTNALHHVAWLILKGVPWLWRRGSDLLPYAASIMLQELLTRERAVLGGHPVFGEQTENLGR